MVARRLASARSRYSVTVFGPAFEGGSFPGVDFRAVHTPRFLPLSPTQRYAIGVALALRKEPPSLIEVHNKPDVASLLARFFPGRPVSLFLHNDPRSMRGARSPTRRGRLMRDLAGVATVSEHIRQMLLEGVTPPPARAPILLHNSIDASELPAPTPVAERDRMILFAGRVVPDKAPDAFVAACALALPKLPGWRAQIIGADGFSSNSPETGFVQQVRQAAATAGVEMLGYRSHFEVLAAMGRAAIVVVPSRWQEPFGLTALEAMACGAAVACSNRGGLAEIMGGAGVVIDPDDPVATAEALLLLAQDETKRGCLSERGRKRASTLFSLQKTMAALDGFRDAIIARDPA